MEEPSLHDSRLALAGGLAAAILVGGAGFLIGRVTSEQPPEPPPPVIAAPATKVEPEPGPPLGILGRPDLIALAALAADAAATGKAPASEVGESAGRRFEIRLPFGCDGAADAADTAPMRWRYDPEDGALRIHVAPVAWSAEDWWSTDAPAGVEVIEGFWITRPWTSSEACPAGARPAASGTEAVTLPGQTLALGQIFFAEGARRDRRDGQPYETIVRVPEDQLDASQGFHVRLSGRIARGPTGPVRCRQPAGAEQRPICLVSVVMDEVAIENPATSETLATWSLEGGRTPPA